MSAVQVSGSSRKFEVLATKQNKKIHTFILNIALITPSYKKRGGFQKQRQDHSLRNFIQIDFFQVTNIRDYTLILKKALLEVLSQSNKIVTQK